MGADIDDGRQGSSGVVWRNWHPGPLDFQPTADLFTCMHVGMFQSIGEN